MKLLRRKPRDGTMSVVEHLTELRYRLVVSAIAFLLASIVAYFFYPSILRVIRAPLDQEGKVGGVEIKDVPLFVSGIAGPFLLRLKVSALAGIVFALPVILFQIWKFITPGLRRNERKYGIAFVLSSAGLFALGVWAAFLMLPTGIKFLLGFVAEGQQPLITFQDYLSFLTLMVLGFGVSFEFPLVLVFLAAIGMVDSRRLRAWRRYAFFVAFIVGALVTPSGDPFSQAALSLPLYVLYELTILFVRLGMRR